MTTSQTGMFPAVNPVSSMTANHSIRFRIIFVALSVVVCSMMLVAWYTYHNNTAFITSLSEDLIKQVNQTIRQKTTSYLLPAAIMTELGSRISAEDIENLPHHNPRLDRLMIEVLKLHPQLQMFPIGNEHGDFLMHFKLPDGTIATKTVIRTENEVRTTFTYRNQAGEVITTQEDPNDNYDPRIRPWYIGAAKTKTNFWSDVYIFFTMKNAGITASYPVLDGEGKVIGVFALDIPLTELSQFIAEQKIGETGIAFIVNHKDEIIAYPDASIPVIKDKGGLRPRKVSELDVSSIQKSYQEYKTHHQAKFVFTDDGTRYIASYIKILSDFENKDWTLGLVIPEDEMIGAINKTNRMLLIIAFAILVAALVFTIILQQLERALDLQARFIRKTFGRYLSHDIVDSILESPQGLRLGGERRVVTILMSDLRGFTSIGERYPAEDIVSIINIYMETMTEIILKHGGTIDEIIGDAILVIFGAPVHRDDDAKRAVACAIEMQLAMTEVNRKIIKKGYPEVAMGIGINTGQVVVGNIGSRKRTKYGVVGSHVNLTSRIESYTLGGQVFISNSTKEACGSALRIDDQLDVMPKGVKESMTIYQVGGIGEDYNLYLPEKSDIQLIELKQPLPIRFKVLEGKHASENSITGMIVRLSPAGAELTAPNGYPKLTNLRLEVLDYAGNEISKDLYGKVTKQTSETPSAFIVEFTSIPQEVKAYLSQLI